MGKKMVPVFGTLVHFSNKFYFYLINYRYIYYTFQCNTIEIKQNEEMQRYPKIYKSTKNSKKYNNLKNYLNL